MRIYRVLGVCLLAGLAMPLSPALADKGFMFGRLFPNLPQYDGPSDAALKALTCGQQAADGVCTQQQPVFTNFNSSGLGTTSALMGAMFDQNIAAPTLRSSADLMSGPGNDDNSIYFSGPCLGGLTTSCPDPSKDVPSFFTYFGQFVDHDMTLDTLPLPDTFVDPTTIANERDPRLNLDSVYGGGPQANPELYENDKKHLRVNGRDLARDPSCVVLNLAVTTKTPCKAILFEGRNDENQVIAQVHVAMIRAHNALIDTGYNLERARELMRWRYQWIIVHQFLPEVLDPGVYADVFQSDGTIHTRYFDPKQAFKAVMPVEFSVAAYRFGHSQVRRAYILLEGCASLTVHCGDSTNPKVQVFNPTNFNANGQDLRGGRQIAADHTIFWPNFLPIDGQPTTGQPSTGQVAANISRKIDTLLSSGLFTMPIPGAEATGPSILAQRNIQRAKVYGLPSGQDVAKRLQQDDSSIHVYTNAEIATAIPRLSALNDASFKRTTCTTSDCLPEAPLWLYILAESKLVHDGHKLGPVGSRIVAEVFGGMLAGDVRSYYRRNWTPDGGSYRAQDLLRDAGVL